MAKRAKDGREPWDVGNRVTPLIGGYAALSAIRDAFEAAIVDAREGEDRRQPPGQRGHVYIVDWLLNALRDLSEENPWGGDALGAGAARHPGPDRARPDRPDDVGRDQGPGAGLDADVDPGPVRCRGARPAALAPGVRDPGPQHQTLRNQGAVWANADPIGVCALDLRTANVTAASLHQKMVVVRVGEVNVGFCGGVDLAFTRRDYRAPGQPDHRPRRLAVRPPTSRSSRTGGRSSTSRR